MTASALILPRTASAASLSRPSKATLQWFAASSRWQALRQRSLRAEYHRRIHAERASERVLQAALDSCDELVERVTALEAAARGLGP